MTRMKTLILSLSLLAASAAPALAHDFRPPAEGGSPSRQLDRRLARLDAAEDLDLARHDAWLDEVERQRLEAQLWREGITGRRAAFERARLEQKQRMRHAANVARLEARQAAREADAVARYDGRGRAGDWRLAYRYDR